MDKCNETLSWLDVNQTAEKEEFDDHQKEIERICNPIITKLYQEAGAGAGPGGVPPTGQPQGNAGGPTIEEVD